MRSASASVISRMRTRFFGVSGSDGRKYHFTATNSSGSTSPSGSGGGGSAVYSVLRWTRFPGAASFQACQNGSYMDDGRSSS